MVMSMRKSAQDRCNYHMSTSDANRYDDEYQRVAHAKRDTDMICRGFGEPWAVAAGDALVIRMCGGEKARRGVQIGSIVRVLPIQMLFDENCPGYGYGRHKKNWSQMDQAGARIVLGCARTQIAGIREREQMHKTHTDGR